MDKTNLVAIVLGAVGLIAAFIMGLLNKNQSLKNEVGMLKGERDIRKEEDDYDKAKDKAKDAEGAYTSLRDKLMRKSDSDS